MFRANKSPGICFCPAKFEKCITVRKNLKLLSVPGSKFLSLSTGLDSLLLQDVNIVNALHIEAERSVQPLQGPFAWYADHRSSLRI
eukprot:4344694-Amphidinium_carterae.1